MNLQFKQSNLALVYLQTKLKETYNNRIKVEGDYYINSNRLYGFAHYIIKYLNTYYPPIGTNIYDTDIPDSNFNHQLNTEDCISIANYFQCDNKGNKLVKPNINTESHKILPNDADNNYINGILVKNSPILQKAINIYKDIYSEFLANTMDINDPPVFFTNMYGNNRKERIYNLYEWHTQKEICEIDDLVMCYLLGRVVSPLSSKEDIYYAQQLLIVPNSNIAIEDRGIWNTNSGNLTTLIMNYQREKIRQNTNTAHPLFVTGYLDVYTEASLLKDRGEQLYGIHGL